MSMKMILVDRNLLGAFFSNNFFHPNYGSRIMDHHGAKLFALQAKLTTLPSSAAKRHVKLE